MVNTSHQCHAEKKKLHQRSYLFHACHSQDCHCHEQHSCQVQQKNLVTPESCYSSQQEIHMLRSISWFLKEWRISKAKVRCERLKALPSCLNSKVSSYCAWFSLKRISSPYKLTCGCHYSNTLPSLANMAKRENKFSRYITKM